MERLSYIVWDAVFLCFNIKDKISMFSIVQWVSPPRQALQR